MDKIRVLCADDNPDSLEILEYFLSRTTEYEIVGKCADGEELIEGVRIQKPDLVLADIRMPKMDGIESIQKCKKFYPELSVIFVTSYDEYAVQAFDLSAVDYLVKPIEKDRLYEALAKYRTMNKTMNASGGSDRLVFRFQGSLFFASYEDIFFIEKVSRKCLIHTRHGIYETYLNLNTLSSQLDNRFCMTHRSYVINLDKMRQIEPKRNNYLIHFSEYEKCAYISKKKYQELFDPLRLN